MLDTILVQARSHIDFHDRAVPEDLLRQAHDLLKWGPTTANRQPALAAYWAEQPGDPFRAYGVMVFAFESDRIVGITGFAGYPQLLPALGLSEELEA